MSITNELSNLANHLISRSEKLRQLHQSIKNSQHDIEYLSKSISQLESSTSRKDKTKHKKQLAYQLRQSEINLAFQLHDWSQVPDSLKSFYHLY